MFHKLVLRFKLNSIGYGPKILGIIGIFLIGAPLAFYGVYLVLGLWGIGVDPILMLIRVSLAIGVFLLGIFGILLAIEFAQDRYLDAYYTSRRQSRLRLPSGTYECQACGHRRIRESERSCPACGKPFMQDDANPSTS